jgi:hypothetical protein
VTNVLVVPQRRLVAGAVPPPGAQDARVLLVLAAQPAGDLGVGAQADGKLRYRG